MELFHYWNEEQLAEMQKIVEHIFHIKSHQVASQVVSLLIKIRRQFEQ